MPIIIGEDQTCFFVWKTLFEAGVFVNPIISPAVPRGRALLRTSYMATHTVDQMDRALEVYAAVGKASRADLAAFSQHGLDNKTHGAVAVRFWILRYN